MFAESLHIRGPPLYKPLLSVYLDAKVDAELTIFQPLELEQVEPFNICPKCWAMLGLHLAWELVVDDGVDPFPPSRLYFSIAMHPWNEAGFPREWQLLDTGAQCRRRFTELAAHCEAGVVFLLGRARQTVVGEVERKRGCKLRMIVHIHISITV